MKCPSCQKTVSLLPDFLIPHFQYTLGAVLKRLKAGLLGKFIGYYQLVQFYRKRFLGQLKQVNHDATFSLENILYETEQQFANTRLEVRYEPEWLENPARPVLLYRDGLKIGEARQVDLATNATLKRRGRGRPAHKDQAPV